MPGGPLPRVPSLRPCRAIWTAEFSLPGEIAGRRWLVEASLNGGIGVYGAGRTGLANMYVLDHRQLTSRRWPRGLAASEEYTGESTFASAHEHNGRVGQFAPNS